MKDLVLEGRVVFEQFLSKIKIFESEEYQEVLNSNDVRVISNRPNHVILMPRNFEAIRDIIPDTKWNLTFTNAAFTRYQKQKYTIYFILTKKESPAYNDKATRKMSVIISPSGEYTCYDSNGIIMDINNVTKITGIAKGVFRQVK